MNASSLELFVKLPLGGVDRRAIPGMLGEHGLPTARADVARWRAAVRPAPCEIADDACVLVLGGSNGILRAVAIQLLFGQRVPVHCVHYDSEKLQVGPHYARAIMEAAAEAGVACTFTNGDATKPDMINATVDSLRGKYRAVHLINGIAAGATKRYSKHGPTEVRDLDVAFDGVRQIPDFSAPECVRRLGLVKVDVATDQDIERTNKMMGTSTVPWAEALAAAGLLVRGESIVAFADYDFEPDDPVYGMGPLAGAKVLQRECMAKIHADYGVRTVRLCYPAMNTTAIGAIPGGMLMFALTAQILLERSQYADLPALARETMALFRRGDSSDTLRMDAAFMATRPEFHVRAARLTPGNVREELHNVFGRV